MKALNYLGACAVAAALLVGANTEAASASANAEVRPGISPLFIDGKNGRGPREYVSRNLDTQARNLFLRNCQIGYSCYAVGEGDGQHTFFELYYCDKRDIMDFLGRGAAVNHQTDDVVAELRDYNHWLVQKINPDNIPVSVRDWGPVWHIEPCADPLAR